MNRVDDGYFAKMYAGDPDPWGFDSRWYERRKYGLTLAALPRERYARAFEAGCANGALTERLVARCDEVVAIELMPEVAARARARVPAATVLTGALPDAWPDGVFDLIVLSEVLYYLRPDGFAEALRRVDASPGAHVVAVHWRGTTDYPLTGDQVHAALEKHWPRIVSYREEAFALDVFEVAR